MSSDYTPPNLVKPTPGGNPGDGTLNGDLTVNGGTLDGGASPTQDFYVSAPVTHTLYLGVGAGKAVGLGKITYVDGVTTVGRGLAPLCGDDARTGLTAADASATTLYTTTAAGQLYRLMGRILATAGTSPSATYTIKWTEGGATITKTLTISALDSDSDLSILIQPDNGTTITAQLTAISGTGTTVNVAATVEQMS